LFVQNFIFLSAFAVKCRVWIIWRERNSVINRVTGLFCFFVEESLFLIAEDGDAETSKVVSVTFTTIMDSFYKLHHEW